MYKCIFLARLLPFNKCISCPSYMHEYFNFKIPHPDLPTSIVGIFIFRCNSIPAPTPDSWLVCWSHRLSDFHSVGVSPWDLIFCCCWKVWSRPFKPDEEIPSYLPIFLPTILPIYLPKRIPLRSDPTYHPTNTNIVNFTFEIYKYSVELFKSKHL